jgi:hypothetical protein
MNTSLHVLTTAQLLETHTLYRALHCRQCHDAEQLIYNRICITAEFLCLTCILTAMMMEETSDPRGLTTTSRDSVSEHNLQHNKPPPVNTNPRFLSYELKRRLHKLLWLL